MKVTIRVKGGEGSGFHNHAGRPGKIGGSAPMSLIRLSNKLQYVDNVDELVVKQNIGGTDTVSYFIAPNGKLLDVHQKSETEHISFVYRFSEEFGIPPMTSASSGRDTWEQVMKNGYIRVRAWPHGNDSQTAIEVNKLDTETLRKLQKMYDNGKLFYTREVTLEGSEDGRQIWGIPFEEFLSAKYVVIDELSRNGYRLKSV